MGRFVRGEVVVVTFPFSDLSGSKRRPALVIAELLGDDLILCQITSQQIRSDKYALRLTKADFLTGGLDKDSLVRPNRIFTADSTKIVHSVVGELNDQKFNEIIVTLTDIITGKI